MERIEFVKIVLDIPVNTHEMKIKFKFGDQQVAVSKMLMEEKYDR